MTKPAELLHEAESIAKSAESWADLSNALFDPYSGMLARAYRDKTKRAAFMRTPEYKKIRKLVTDAKHKFGLTEGATPKVSGKFVVRIPRTLHESLKSEASNEGVSLNQLVVFKLAAQSSVYGKFAAVHQSLKA